MDLLNIKVIEFSKFPGPRFKNLGPHSGEEFRDSILLPAIKLYAGNVKIDLDGAFGYGSSFLEEVFGGTVRAGVSKEIIDQIVSNLKSEEEPELIEEVRTYVNEELSRQVKG